MVDGLLPLLAGAGLYYLGMPVVIHNTMKSEANPHLQSLDPASLPPAVADYVYATANALRADGFVPEAYISLPHLTQSGEFVPKAYSILLVNRALGHKAWVNAITLMKPDKQLEINCYVEFSTRYASGYIVGTLNTPTIGVFDRVPNKTKCQVPQITHPRRLYAFHSFVCAKIAPISSEDRPVLFAEGEAETFFREALMRELEGQVALGILYRDGSGEHFRPTWKGAYKMTWRLMQPMKTIVRQQHLKPGKDALRAFTAAQQADKVQA